jgi:hypothetical protein
MRHDLQSAKKVEAHGQLNFESALLIY